MIMQIESRYHVNEQQLSVEQQALLEAKADPARFDFFYKKYYEQIFRFVYQRVDSPDTAADITSQVFLKALVNLKKFEFRGLPFASWLYRIAKNELNLAYRKKKTDHVLNIESENIQDMAEEIEFTYSDALRDQIIQVIDQLPDADIELIELRFFEKRPFKEIGEILDITENNAKVKTYRILDKLRKQIQK